MTAELSSPAEMPERRRLGRADVARIVVIVVIAIVVVSVIALAVSSFGADPMTGT